MQHHPWLRRPLRALAALLALSLLSGGTALASPVIFVAQLECDIQEPVCLLIVPDGSGPGFAGAHAFGGATVDATMRLQLLWADEWGNTGIAPDVPASEIVVLPEVFGAIGGCNGWGIAQADMDTDQYGWTTISLAPRAFGWSDAPIMIEPYIENGLIYPPIYFNSPDINADGAVDLVDVGLFAQDFNSGSAPIRSDFHWDGVLDLADVGIMAQHLGAACP